MENKHIILAIHIVDRIQKAANVQNLFTEYGCHIKTRIGLHDVESNFCSPSGIILLELVGDEARCQELHEKLSQIEGIEVKSLVFEH